MEENNTGTTNDHDNQGEIDPWVAAFAALEHKGEEGSEDTSNSDPAVREHSGSEDSSEQDPIDDDSNDNESNEDNLGGLDNPAEPDGGENRGTAFDGLERPSEEYIKQYRQELESSIREQAINDIANEFIKRGLRNNNGVLGATIEDPDICQRDEDGVPHFFNPETGREFTGDNPRRQAQEWVDDYNRELARVFNESCEKYEKHLLSQGEPALKVLEFAPKYDKLDQIRKGMFENVIKDYEIEDESGKVIGYSCDLDKALALVERQISTIQQYAKQTQQAKPTGPALDMKSSSGAVQADEPRVPKSLAEAMEMKQNEILESMKNR